MIEPETWDAVQARLTANRTGHRRREAAAAPSLLAGLLVDSRGERLTPSHAVKQGRRYRYYVSRALIANSGADGTVGWRLPAHDVEDAVIRIIAAALSDPASLIQRLQLPDASAEQSRSVLDRATRLAEALRAGSPGERSKLAIDLIERVVIDKSVISVVMRQRPLLAKIGAGADASSDDTIQLSAPIAFRRRGVETKLVLPASIEMQKPARVDPALVKAVARGRLWFEQLATGEMVSLEAISNREGVSARYVSRLLPLAFIAPDIIELILHGLHPADLTAARLTNRLDLPLDWARQGELIGA